MDARVLFVSRNPAMAKLVVPTLPRGRGACDLETMSGFDAALQEIEQGGVEVALLHVTGPEDEDQAACLLKELMDRPSHLPVIVLSESDELDLRRRFLELGAVDSLARPLNLSRLAFLLDILTVPHRCAAVPAAASPPPSSVDGFLFVTGAMRALYEQFAAVAPLETTLLLTGETGTGKSHVSQVIHKLSPRRQKPFVVVECGGLSPTLLESELFGHVRGAFTGADRDHTGKFATVEDGTILLDEIDCVPLDAQVKLLRVLERRVFEPLGSNRLMPFRARIIAASNQPLDCQVAAGRFRSDLFYRLNVVDFHLPPLRDSREAIRPLAEKFLTTFAARDRRQIAGLTAAALGAMEAYDWPGNIRELRNTVERAVALCRREQIDLRDLPEPVRRSSGRVAPTANSGDPPVGNQLVAARRQGELLRVLEALRHHGNNRTQAAAELGISRVALYKKLRKLEIA